jgi:hypothetical protein
MLWWARILASLSQDECREETLIVALRLCRVAAESTARRGHYAPLVEHSIAWERSSNGLEHLLLRGVMIGVPSLCRPHFMLSA